MEREKPRCRTCGRVLGVGFYWTCPKCGVSYCYPHIPTPENHVHEKPKVLPADQTTLTLLA